jgi:hypothetical protein
MFIQEAGEDQNVIKIDGDDSLCDKVLEELMHHSLECNQTIGETKVHHKQLKQDSICIESDVRGHQLECQHLQDLHVCLE